MEPVDETKVRKLEEMAVDSALNSGQLADIEKAISLLKATADREKTSRENRHGERLLRFESYKTFATAIVPLLTLATLAFTVWIQARQLTLTAEANSDTDWRDVAQKVLAQLPKSKSDQGDARSTEGSSGIQLPKPENDQKDARGTGNTAGDPWLATQLLRPYLKDKRHGTEAVDLALFVVSRVPDARAALNLYASPYVRVTPENLETFLSRGRDTAAALDSVNDAVSAQQMPYFPTRQAGRALDTNLELWCAKITDAVRDKTLAKTEIKFARAHLYNCSFADLALPKAVFSDATVDQVDFSRADLSTVTKFENSTWPGSNWWDAKAINGGLLQYLSTSYYPFFDPDESLKVPPPDAVAYRHRLQSLCKAAKVVCGDLSYGPQAPRGAPSGGRLSVDLAQFVTEHDYANSFTAGRADSDFAPYVKELVDSGLCTRSTAQELRDSEKGGGKPAGTYSIGIDCNDAYRLTREFLIDSLRPEFVSLGAASVGPKEKAVLNSTTMSVRHAFPSLSATALIYALKSDDEGNSSFIFAGDDMGRTDGDSADAFVNSGLCTEMNQEQLRAEDQNSKKPPGYTLRGIQCGANILDLKAFILKHLVPELAARVGSGG